MPARLTQRDERLLAKMAAARWLTTSQIRRFFFREATLDAVRKRMRKLLAGGYLSSYRANRMAEAIHTVGPRGKLALERKGLEVELERKPPDQLAHFVGVNDIRMAVECAGVPIVYFFAAWELLRLGWSHPVIPDAVFAFQQGKRMTFVVEYDRSNETVDQFFMKLRFYQEGLGSFSFDAVVIVTDTQGRIETLGRYLRKRGVLTNRCLAATLGEIRQANMFAEVFADITNSEADLRRRSLRDFGSLVGVSFGKETLS